MNATRMDTTRMDTTRMDTRGLARWAAMLVVGLTAGGCGWGDAALEEVDPDSIPARVTYTMHVGPRVDYYCVACHGPGGKDDGDGWDFSTYELVKASFGSIARAAIEEQNMPPGGARRLTAEDAAILLRWRDRGFER